MIPPTKTDSCNSSLWRRLLQSELDELEEREFVVHLNACSICRTRLESDDASNAVWNDARMYLRSGRSGINSKPNEDSQRHEMSPMIRAVLNLLGPTDDPNMLGRIGPYEVSGVVGSGGMGVVLKAIDNSLDRTIAIKVLAPHLATSGSAKNRFAREAKAAAAVLHPNVIAVHSVCAENDPPYLVMPYISGTSLQTRLDKQGPFQLLETLRIGAQVAAGLAASHEQGLVHRDIKPANILLEDGVERVTITDFGLARAIDDASLTISGLIAGTPSYMSPEQSRCEPITQSSDLFSLGSVLYAISTGRPPFRAESTYGVMKRIADEQPTSIRELNSEIPEWFERLVFWLMQKDVAMRPCNAKTVEGLLRRCIAHFEQPQHNLLPHELNSPASRRFTTINRKLVMSIGFAAILIPATWILTAQIGTRDANSHSTSDDNAKQIVSGQTDVDDYEISLKGMGVVSKMQMSTQFDVARMNMQQQNFQQFGQATSNGSVSGGVGGAGGGFGQTYKKPNFGVAFDVKPKQQKTDSFVEIGSTVQIVESDGSLSESPTLGPVIHRFVEFENRFPSTLAAYLYREDKGTPTQVNGELRVIPGKRITAQFAGTKKQSKPVGKESITLESVKSDREGVQVVVSFPELTSVRNARTPQEQFQAAIDNRSAYSASILDSKGSLLTPISGTNLSNQTQSTFSFSNINGAQAVQGNVGSPKNPSQTFTFKPLENVTKIEQIVVTFTDRTGEARIVPFSIKIKMN